MNTKITYIRFFFKVVSLVNRAVFHVYFQKCFFFEKEKMNRFEFLICYYSHLKDTENKFLKKFNNILLLLWLFKVGASKKKARGWPGS